MLTKGQERCLVVWPRAEFEAYSEKLRANAQANAQVRAVTRVFFSSAFDESVDAQGRLTIPPVLREYAGLERELTVVGADTRIEIWSSTSVGRLPRRSTSRPSPSSTWREVSRCPSGSRHPHHLIPLRGFDAPSPAPNRPRRPFPGAGPRRGAWCSGPDRKLKPRTEGKIRARARAETPEPHRAQRSRCQSPSR